MRALRPGLRGGAQRGAVRPGLLGGAQLLALIQGMLGDHNIPVENIHIKAGSAAKVIPSLASKHAAGLVVIGSIGRKGLKA